MKKSILHAVLLTGPISLALTACANNPPDPRTGPALVQAIGISAAEQGQLSFSGIVTARVQSDLGFRVPGKVVARLVDAGQTVRRGQPLMRIDGTDYAFGASAAANTVAAARAKAQQTAADERRYRDLVAAGAVSASRYDQAKADADAARAHLDAALAQAGVARNEVGYAILVADADGVVVETLAEPGQVVAAGQTVVKLAHSGPREATISLPETIRPKIGSIARVSLYGSNGHAGSARMRQLSDAADPQTRTYDARYVLEGAAAQAPLGSTVSLSIADDAPGSSSGAAVPLSALYDNGHGPGVWKLIGNRDALRVHWVPVSIASLGDETAIVTYGLRPTDRFVALGAHMLHEGQSVVLSADKLAFAQ